MFTGIIIAKASRTFLVIVPFIAEYFRRFMIINNINHCQTPPSVTGKNIFLQKVYRLVTGIIKQIWLYILYACRFFFQINLKKCTGWVLPFSGPNLQNYTIYSRVN